MMSSAALAQSYSEGFNSGLPTTGAQGTPGLSIALPSGNWFALNQSSPLGVTGVFQGGQGTTFAGHMGGQTSYAAMNFNNGAGTATLSTYFMTPVVTLNNGDMFSFWSRTVNTPAFPDRLFLRMSTNGSSTNTADFSTVLLTINNGLTTGGYPNVWTQFSVTVSGLGGPTSGRFAFHYSVPNGGPNGANSDFIGIDTVQYTAVPAPGAAALLGLAGFAAARRRR